jgi:hypothetical protein
VLLRLYLRYGYVEEAAALAVACLEMVCRTRDVHACVCVCVCLTRQAQAPKRRAAGTYVVPPTLLDHMLAQLRTAGAAATVAAVERALAQYLAWARQTSHQQLTAA